MTTPLVRAADIAAIAGVSRAAVTQWRKRHKDFPAPKEGLDSESPLFDRTEVEHWLERTNRRRTPRRSEPTPEVLAQRATDHLRGISDEQHAADRVGAALTAEYITRALHSGSALDGPAAAVGQVDRPDRTTPSTLANLSHEELAEWLNFLGSASPELSLALKPLSEPTGRSLDFVITLAGGLGELAAEKFVEIYDVLLHKDYRRSYADPPALAQFLADLAAIDHGTVLDPAVGTGITLLTVGAHRNVALVGVDLNAWAHATAVRRAVLTNRAIDLRVGNSLGDDPAAGVLADVVVCSPPWGRRDFGPDVDLHDPRWAFGRPSPRSEGIWLQHAIGHLEAGGRAFVATPSGELWRSSSEKLRHELLRQGTVEAVIGLPQGIFEPYTRVPPVIWVLTRPGQTVDRDHVLLVNVPGPINADGVPVFDAAVEQYRTWRQNGAVHDTEYSVVVPVRDLLEPGVGLSPTTWLKRRDAPTPEQLLEQIAAAHRLVTGTAIPEAPALPDFRPATTVRREKLTALPGITVHRGLFLTPEARKAARSGTGPETGVPLLTGVRLRQLRETDTVEPTEFVSPREVRDTTLTQPGDIVVTSTGTARRIELDGWVVAAPDFLVRVDPTTATMDPDYLLAVINAATHAQLDEGIRLPRILPSGIDVPVIPLPAQQRLGETIRNLARTTAAIEHHLQQRRTLSRLLETAAGAGALTLPD